MKTKDDVILWVLGSMPMIKATSLSIQDLVYEGYKFGAKDDSFQRFYHGLIMGHNYLSDHDKKYLINSLDKEWDDGL